MMRSANPALRANVFQNVFGTAYGSEAMTLDGTVNKTGLLLLILIAGSALTWGNTAAMGGWLVLGVFGGLIAALVTAFKPNIAMYTAPVYAFLEGIFLGGISSIFEMRYPGIVTQAVLLTFGTAAVMLILYRTHVIKVTQKFRLGVFAATGGIMMAYFLSFILSLFGVHIGIFWGNGLFGIVFNLVVVGVAALNLLLDFDFIDEASAQNAPKFMEWYGAFSLIVTLVWLYIEFLRLLSRFQRQ